MRLSAVDCWNGGLAYVATPYSKYKGGDLNLAFIDAAKLMALLLRAGIKCYSPICHTHPIAIAGNLDPLDHSIWLPFDQAMMQAADVLIVAHMEGWQESYGIAEEIKFFEAGGKSIFDLDPKTLRMERRKPLGNEPSRGKRIYVASSWRNAQHPGVVTALREQGHEVYDFRNPKDGNNGFSWREIDPDWMGWSPAAYARLIHHPIAHAGFLLDKEALDWCDTCVLVLPCGRSAHLEAGYACGQGKRVIFYLQPEKFEPELMYLLGSALALTLDDVCTLVRSDRITNGTMIGKESNERSPLLKQTNLNSSLAHNKIPSEHAGTSE